MDENRRRLSGKFVTLRCGSHPDRGESPLGSCLESDVTHSEEGRPPVPYRERSWNGGSGGQRVPHEGTTAVLTPSFPETEPARP